MKKAHSEIRSPRRRDLLDRSNPLAKILKLADDAIISVDRKQTILLFNDGAEKMFGYTAAEVKGESLDILLPARLAVVHREHVAAFGESGVEAQLMGRRREIVGRRKDGSEFPAEASISRVELQGDPVFTVFMHDITQRALAEEQLRASLREKELLIDEIHHRVKNNLQVITSLLGLQARSVNDAATRKKFEESQHRIQSMAILHEILIQTGSLKEIDCAEYIRKLSEHLVRSYGVGAEIRLRLNLQPVSLPMDAAVSCGLIINELLSNSFKHAFPNKAGDVRIDLTQQPGGAIDLLVADNGVGLPPGLNWQTSPSLGLRLVRTLASQLEASIESDHSHGTAYSVTFHSNPVTRR